MRTARAELLAHTLIWNQLQLRRLLTEYLAHYNTHRPHRGLPQRAPDTLDQPSPQAAPLDAIRRRRIVGGLINQYHRAA